MTLHTATPVSASNNGPRQEVTYGAAPRPEPPRVLMIHPLFMGATLWAMTEVAKLYNAQAFIPPLGLMTVAALLPDDWQVEIVDRNVRDLTDADIAGADLIMAGGMLPQRADLLTVIAWAQRLGKPVAVGGPDVMSSPQVYAHADFAVTGEAETVMDAFVAAWRDGAVRGRFDPERFKADVTAVPAPRFDLIDSGAYTQMTVQFSRGCPFTCEFCDIIELFGRRPRTKSTDQMLAELDAIRQLGYRGHVNFVDDNLIGNKKAVKAFLPHLIAWQKAHGFPFDFSTEASLNLADDSDLMAMMAAAGFIGVFIGIESPDPDVLIATKKKQNTKRDIAESVHTVFNHGLFVLAGFIVGFDEEKRTIGEDLADLVDEAAIPLAIVGLLYALPGTQLTRRLEAEGRLHPQPTLEEVMEGEVLDQCVQGLNFDTLRPRVEVLRDYRTVIARTYNLKNYHDRTRRMASHMNFEHATIDVLRSGFWKNASFVLRLSWRMGVAASEGKRLFWATIWHAVRTDPRTLEGVLLALAAWLHVGPFSKKVLSAVDQKIAEAEAAGIERMVSPSAATAVPVAAE